MKTKFIVSDTNIFIDLIEMSLLGEFFNLPWEIHTTDFVLHELTDENQKKQIDMYRETNDLLVKNYSADELLSMIESYYNFEHCDCLTIAEWSAWQMAQELHCPLITSYKKLRSLTENTTQVYESSYLFNHLKNVMYETCI